MEWLPFVMFAFVCFALMAGYSVAFTLGGSALLFAGVSVAMGWLNPSMLNASAQRIFGVMNNQVLVAVPLFVFMGVMLERAKIAENLLDAMTRLFGGLRGGLALSVIIVGMLLAASTGIVGATVVTMGMLSLPVMLKRGYDQALSTGTICASGTLGQIIPPSIVLILLGESIASAHRSSYGGDPINVGDLFIGALIPGLLLVAAYMVYVVTRVTINPALAPSNHDLPAIKMGELIRSLLLPLSLIFLVLGSILTGIATPTEAAAIGAAGATLLAIYQREFDYARLKDVMLSTTKTSSMVFMILIGASIFSLVFRALGGDAQVHGLLSEMPGGVVGAIIVVMLVMFLLGFILDFIEIIYVVVPIVAPVLLAMGVDPIWLGIMIALNLQTSFLTPPFGFALFYLRGVTPDTVTTRNIYRGAVPFIFIQLGLLILLGIFPELATWLPEFLSE
ncbi:TRAP transporter large permease [Pleionea litopenaei]|uniref:TRAP transporter large permease protein n=1 Tax=Pleionea litopenaei TaxID=3070815 RepID=A0AA51X5M7_9GAMM|nr:TRAP transporter large permease subunit [Pleionea sp. HL-JVS1]WMS86153.1 TRAP transporter large permease subunit [Pleionea sp. HL-JVS1]